MRMHTHVNDHEAAQAASPLPRLGVLGGPHGIPAYVTVMGTADATVAELTYPGLTATGTAKRMPGDKPDARTGELLATARAYASMARKLERLARGRMSDAEHRRNRVHKPLAKWRAEQDEARERAAGGQHAALGTGEDLCSGPSPHVPGTPGSQPGHAADGLVPGTPGRAPRDLGHIGTVNISPPLAKEDRNRRRPRRIPGT